MLLLIKTLTARERAAYVNRTIAYTCFKAFKVTKNRGELWEIWILL